MYTAARARQWSSEQAEDTIYAFPEDSSSIVTPSTRHLPRVIGSRPSASDMSSRSRRRAPSQSERSSMLRSNLGDNDDSWKSPFSAETADIEELRKYYSFYRHTPCTECLWTTTLPRKKASPCANDQDGKQSCESCIKKRASCTNPDTFDKELGKIAIKMQQALRERLEDDTELPEDWKNWVEYVEKSLSPNRSTPLTAKKKLDEVIKSTTQTNSAIQERLDKLDSMLESVQERLEALEVDSGEHPDSAGRAIKERLDAVEKTQQTLTTKLSTMGQWFRRLVEGHMGLSMTQGKSFKPADYLRLESPAFQNVTSQLNALWDRVGGQPEADTILSPGQDAHDEDMVDTGHFQTKGDMEDSDESQMELEEGEA